MGSVFSTLMSFENFLHACSGATASVMALSVFFPLDTIRTRKQVTTSQSHASTSSPYLLGIFAALRDVRAKEGVSGLYKGYSAVVTSLCCSNFVYFYAYVGLKKLLKASHGQERNPAVDLLTAYIAGTINVFMTTPLWVANTRLKLQGLNVDYKKSDDQNKDESSQSEPGASSTSIPSRTYKGIHDALTVIAKEEGVAALYSGTLPSLVLVLNPAIHWMCYEFLKSHCQRMYGDGSDELSGVSYFIISAISKFISTTLTYPLQVIQTRQRFMGHDSFPKMIKNLVKENGFAGLYQGLETKMAQTVLTSAFMFVVYEKVVALLLRMARGQVGSSSKLKI